MTDKPRQLRSGKLSRKNIEAPSAWGSVRSKVVAGGVTSAARAEEEENEVGEESRSLMVN